MMKTMGKTGEKCGCNLGHGLLAVALFASGFFVLIEGLAAQWNGAGWNPVLFWYFVGFLLISAGKVFKKMAGACCAVHGDGMCCK